MHSYTNLAIIVKTTLSINIFLFHANKKLQQKSATASFSHIMRFLIRSFLALSSYFNKFGKNIEICGITSFIAANIHSKILFLLLVNVVLLVMGMFMEGVASIIIVAPLIYPAAVALGVDPIHLGTIMISNLAIGMFTPPFGMNIFVTSSITKADMVEMLPGIIRFFIVDLIALLLITYIPQISMFLPNLLK